MRALRDISLSDLESHGSLLSEVVYRRCRHIVTKNARRLAIACAVRSGDTAALPQRMADVHRNIRDDLEVSCLELDIMVQLAEQQPGVLGARKTGGGFGGCTINLVEKEHAAAFSGALKERYKTATSIDPEIFICHASAGAHRVA